MPYIRLKTTHPQKFVTVDYAEVASYNDPSFFAGIASGNDERPGVVFGNWKTLRGIKQGLNKKLKRVFRIELDDDINKLDVLNTGH